MGTAQTGFWLGEEQLKSAVLPYTIDVYLYVVRFIKVFAGCYCPLNENNV